MNLHLESECRTCTKCDHKEIVLDNKIRTRVLPCTEHAKDIYKYLVGLTQPESRECTTCMQLFLPIRDYMTLCEDCYQDKCNDRKECEKRQCVGCHEMNVPIVDPPWKALCDSCFSIRIRKTSKEKPDNRKCGECDRRLIPPEWPSYRSLCIACYKSRTFKFASRIVTKVNPGLPKLG